MIHSFCEPTLPHLCLILHLALPSTLWDGWIYDPLVLRVKLLLQSLISHLALPSVFWERWINDPLVLRVNTTVIVPCSPSGPFQRFLERVDQQSTRSASLDIPPPPVSSIWTFPFVGRVDP